MRLLITPDPVVANPAVTDPVVTPGAAILPAVGPKEAARRAEEFTGGPVGVLPVDLNLVRAAMLEGVLVDVSIHCWRGSSRLTPADIGLSGDAAKASKEQGVGETILLIPESVGKAVEAADTKFRRAMRENGFRIQGYRGWFIPAKNWDSFRETYDSGVKDFEAAIENLCANLDKHRQTVERNLRALAPRAWRGHRASWDEYGSAAAGAFEHVDEPTTAFVDWFVVNFSSRIPTAEIIRDSAQVIFRRNILHVPEVASALEAAKTHAGMREDLLASLQEQRESLPARFIDGVVRSVLQTMQRCYDGAMKSRGRQPGAGTRMVGVVRKSVAEARHGNLTQDPRIEKALSNLEIGLRTTEARASGGQRSVAVEEVLAPLHTCLEQLATLATAGDE
jgi:hypothetical protein